MKNTTQLFLTGSNGIIGSYLYDELNKDYKVFTSKFRGEKTINFSTSVDFTDKIQLDTLVQEIKHFDVLIFLIGLAHKKGNIKEISSFDLINKRTLVNFLFYLEKYNKVPKKIIFASSISVYGENFGQTVYNEDSTKNPKSPYAKTKLSAENFLLDNYYNNSWILRFAPVYSSKFLLNIIKRTQFLGIPFKVSKGETKLSLCNIDNIVKIIYGIIENKVPFGVYNVSDEKDYTYNDLLNYLNVKWFLPIPEFVVKTFELIGNIFQNIYLMENTKKLLYNNIFPSNKIRKFIKVSSSLND